MTTQSSSVMTGTRQTGYVETHGARLYYEVDGEGPPLTLIHAGVANLRQWDPQLPAFAQRHRVIRFDTRGFGRTTTKDVPFSNRDDIGAVLDHLGVERTALLGNSRGGVISVDFTLEHPERVSALIPVAAGISGWESAPTPQEKAIWEEYEERYEAKDWDWIIESETAVWADGPGQARDRLPAEIRQQVHDWITESYEQHGTEEPQPRPLEPPADGRLGEIAVPTLVMIGDLDTSDTQAASRRLAAEIPGARLEVFPGVAHMVNLEEPERFERLVLDFLAETREPS